MIINTLYHNKTTLAKGRSIEYIVIHYTAGTTSKTGTAMNTANYFKTSAVEGSADYVVDDEEIYLCNSDIKNYYSWAIGGSKYTSMSTSEGGKFYGKCTNKNSISIEICSNKSYTKTLLATDTDWYFTDSALNLAGELVRKLMSDYDVPLERVIMHHHVTGKICPNPFCVNEMRLAQWQNFKNLISGSTIIGDDEMVETGIMFVNGKEYKVDKINKDGSNFIKLANFSNMGFDVGFNANTKINSLDNSKTSVNVNYEENIHSLESINLNGTNYIKIRDLEKLGFTVGYNAETKQISISK